MKFALTLKQTFLVALVIFGGIQFIPAERTNPPVEMTRVGPDNATKLFRRACFDCHSNETVWPWYAKVAPFSWMVIKDVERGREALNFSTWNRLSLREQEEMKDKAWKKVKSGDMPPPFYGLGHPDASVTTNDHRIIKAWVGIPVN